MHRRSFLRGLGAALVAANLWFMPSRPQEPEWLEVGEGSIYGVRVLPNDNLATADLTVDALRRASRRLREANTLKPYPPTILSPEDYEWFMEQTR